MIITAVGNYPKVAKPSGANLRRAIGLLDQGKASLEEVAKVEDSLTIEVLQEQASAGLDLVTDGQVRWEDGQTYLARKLKGFSISGLIRYFDTNTYYRQPVVESKVAWVEPITVNDYAFAARHSQRPVKPIITGPYTIARLSGNQHYANLSDLVLDLAVALNQEALALEKAGASIIQFDEPAILKNPEDFPLFERAMKRLAQGLTAKTALYTYFGHLGRLYPGFLQLPFNVFGLDFVMGHQNFDIVTSFPRDKELGFGIADARNTRLEPAEELVGAIKKIVRVVPADRLYVNPSCGLEFLPRDRALAKLARLVEGVNKAKEVLFR